jgi:hypothetical protein
LCLLTLYQFSQISCAYLKVLKFVEYKMEHEETAELAVSKNEDYSSMSLYLDNDGGIQLVGYDSGPGIQDFFGKDDYECWAIVPPAAVGRLAFALLKENFKGIINAVHESL